VVACFYDGKTEVMCDQVGLSVFSSVMLSVCRITAKGNQLISLKLGATILPANWKNWLFFGGIQSRIRIQHPFSTFLTIAE